MTDQTPRAVLLRLDQVEAQPVTWLWPGRIPLGKLTVLDGDPGLGKSTLALDLAARVSRGSPMPDGTAGIAGGALILSAEDGVEDTIVPRLQTAGADLRYIVTVPVVQCAEYERPPLLPADLQAMKDAIAATDWELGVRLVVIDPLMAFLSADVDSWRDQDVRRALYVLAEFARESQAAVVLIRHLTKARGTSAMHRGGGSIGIIGAARAGLLVARDPEDSTRRVLAVTKMNLAPEPPSLGFRLEGSSGYPRIVWTGTSPHGADVLVAEPVDEDERRDVQDLRVFVREMLEQAPRTFKEVQAACRAAGYEVTDRTLRNVRRALGVESKRTGFGPGSVITWSLRNGHTGSHTGIDDGSHEPPGMPVCDRYDALGDGRDRLPGQGDAAEPDHPLRGRST